MSTGNSCSILNETTGEKFGPLKDKGHILVAQISSDKATILTASQGHNMAILRDANNAKPTHTFEHNNKITWVGFLSIKCALTASLDKTIKLWDIQTGNLINTLEHNFPVFRVYIANEYIKACSLAEEKITYWPLSSVDYNNLSFKQFILSIKLQQYLESKTMIQLNKKWTKIFHGLPELLKIKFYPALRKRNKK